MLHDNQRLDAELERLERELELELELKIDREILHHDLQASAEEGHAAAPGRRHVERSLLAGASLLVLALGVHTLGHLSPAPPPTGRPSLFAAVANEHAPASRTRTNPAR